MQSISDLQGPTLQDSKPVFSSQGCDPTLFLSSLHFEITLQDLHDHFNQFGKVAAIKINKKGLPSKKSTAMMRMETEEAVERLIAHKNQFIKGHEIFVEKKLSGKDLVLKNEEIGVRRIHISNIPAHINGEDLLKLFSEHGRVEMAYSKQPKDSESCPEVKIYGFITFFDAEDAQKLVDMKTVKFDCLEEPLEIKSFNKKSIKLSLDYFNKNQETIKVKGDSKKGKNKSKKRQRGAAAKQAEIKEIAVATRESSPVEVFINQRDSEGTEDGWNMFMAGRERRAPISKLLFSSVMSNHTVDNVKLNKVGVAPARQSFTFFVQPSAN
jgi:RNA recognition motif-containing protein